MFEEVYDFCSGALAKDWTPVFVPPGVLGELLLDRVLSLFCKVDMRLPFLPIIGATDASTQYGLGGVVSHADTSEVRRVARLTCKAGGHVCVDDGPELVPELEARLGPRYDLKLTMRNFDVVFSIRIDSPNHINLEEGAALIRYLKWVLRARTRFRHRVVGLIDSKVVLGAITKGRSSFRLLNALIRRAAAL